MMVVNSESARPICWNQDDHWGLRLKSTNPGAAIGVCSGGMSIGLSIRTCLDLGVCSYGSQMKRRAAEDRFLDLVSPEPNTGCWLWTGYRQRDGYGTFRLDPTRKVKAHRFSYERDFGRVPDGLQLDHTCRTRCCVNPRHLRLVTC